MTRSAKLFSLPILCLVLLTLSYTRNMRWPRRVPSKETWLASTGLRLVGVTVTIDRKDIKQHFEIKKTDKKGHYFHAGLPVSYYRVAVVQDGKELYFFDNIKVPLGDTMKLDFNLKQEMERAKTQPREMTAEEKAAKAKQDEEGKKHETMKSRFEKAANSTRQNSTTRLLKNSRRRPNSIPRSMWSTQTSRSLIRIRASMTMRFRATTKRLNSWRPSPTRLPKQAIT